MGTKDRIRTKSIIIIIFLLGLFCLAISGDKTIVDTKPVKMSADSTVKVPSTDEVQRIANNYDKQIADLQSQINELRAKVNNLEAQINQ